MIKIKEGDKIVATNSNGHAQDSGVVETAGPDLVTYRDKDGNLHLVSRSKCRKWTSADEVLK